MANSKKDGGTDWAKIKAAYIRGALTVPKIAAKYNAKADTIYKRAYREGWQRAKREISERASEKFIEKAADLRAKTMESLERSTLMAAKKIEADLEAFLERKGTRITQEVVDVEEKGKPKRVTIEFSFGTTVNLLNGIQRQLLEAQKLNGTVAEVQDDGFLDALSSDCAEAWTISDEPANLHDSNE